MQPFLTVRAVLADVARLHETCRHRLVDAARSTADLRTKVLLTFLAEREGEQLRAIARLGAGDDVALECFVQSVPASPYADAWQLASPAGDCEQIAEGYRRREFALEHCFALLKDGVGPRAATVFAELEAMKRQNQVRLQEASLDF